MKWRIIQNEWNKKVAPWSGAVGIEEDDDSVAVPAIVCWFTRGWHATEDDDDLTGHPALEVVLAHNGADR